MPNKNAYLKEMGIEVWRERNPVSKTSSFEISNLEITEEALPEQLISTPIIIPAELEKNNKSQNSENIDVDTLDWQALRIHVEKCQLCELAKNRTQTLLGSGNETASLMIIGNAPTVEDEQKGDVFLGDAGKLLTAMLNAMGYQRKDVYLSNIVKCRTTDNHDPSEEQSSSCASYLHRQISLLKPKLILALGNAAAQTLLKTKSTMARLRGQLHYVDDISAPILVSYHPAYLLAAPNEKRKAWQDLQRVMKELKK